MKKITFHRTNDNKDYNKISWTKLILFIEHRKHFYVKKKLCLSNTKNYKEIKILIRKLRLHPYSAHVRDRLLCKQRQRDKFSHSQHCINIVTLCNCLSSSAVS